MKGGGGIATGEEERQLEGETLTSFRAFESLGR